MATAKTPRRRKAAQPDTDATVAPTGAPATGRADDATGSPAHPAADARHEAPAKAAAKAARSRRARSPGAASAASAASATEQGASPDGAEQVSADSAGDPPADAATVATRRPRRAARAARPADAATLGEGAGHRAEADAAVKAVEPSPAQAQAAEPAQAPTQRRRRTAAGAAAAEPVERAPSLPPEATDIPGAVGATPASGLAAAPAPSARQSNSDADASDPGGSEADTGSAPQDAARGSRSRRGGPGGRRGRGPGDERADRAAAPTRHAFEPALEWPADAPAPLRAQATSPALEASADAQEPAPVLGGTAADVAPVAEAVVDLLLNGKDAASDLDPGADADLDRDDDADADGDAELDDAQGPDDEGEDGRDGADDLDNRPAPAPRAAPSAPSLPPPLPSGGPDSRIERVDGDRAQVFWRPGSTCPERAARALQSHLLGHGEWPPQAESALPALLRAAAEAGHRIQIDPGVWPLWATHRDARQRAALLQSAYPDGPDSPALGRLLAVPLAPFQAEGALWAVVAGRGLIADAAGLGKSVQAMAAAMLWRRHFGLQRVLVLGTAASLSGWRHAWRRLAGVSAQDLPASGALPDDAPTGLNVCLATPVQLARQREAVADWMPQLLIVDEPQRLGLDPAGPTRWGWPETEHQLVLSGEPLENSPELLDQLIDQLDPQRLGPLQALRQVQAAQLGAVELSDTEVEAIGQALSRVLLQRQAWEVREQLPDVLWQARWWTPGPEQRQAHDAALARLRRELTPVLRSQQLPDSQQWRLSQALVAALDAVHSAPANKAQPGDAFAAAVDATLDEALAVLQRDAEALADAQDGAPPATAAEPARPLLVLLAGDTAGAEWWRAHREARSAAGGDAQDDPPVELCILPPGQPLPRAAAGVVQLDAPWSLSRRPLGGGGAGRSDGAARPALPQRRWAVMAAGTVEMGLWDSAALRVQCPRGPAEPGGKGFLAGEARNAWLLALAALQEAMAAMPAGPGTGQPG